MFWKTRCWVKCYFVERCSNKTKVLPVTVVVFSHNALVLSETLWCFVLQGQMCKQNNDDVCLICGEIINLSRPFDSMCRYSCWKCAKACTNIIAPRCYNCTAPVTNSCNDFASWRNRYQLRVKWAKVGPEKRVVKPTAYSSERALSQQRTAQTDPLLPCKQPRSSFTSLWLNFGQIPSCWKTTPSPWHNQPQIFQFGRRWLQHSV